MEDRNRIIVRSSVIGIAANVVLVLFKMVTGLVTNSIAIILDAVNNLSDALSSVITIIGNKLASRRPDKKHPLGHGRIEFISALVVAAIIVYAGITSLIESIKKIIEPEEAEYTVVSLIIVGAAVFVKIFLGLYMKKKGREANSSALEASGSDALFDAILSTSVLLSAIIFMVTGLKLEAYVGVVISCFIIKAGIDMLRDTLDEILGKRVEGEEIAGIKRTICEEEAVRGAYDLILHNYGPDRYVGSVHVEIPDTLNANEIDLLERRIAGRVYEKHGIIMAAIGIYSINTTDEEIVNMREDVTKVVMSHEGVLQTHGFFVDKEAGIINVDVIIDYDLKNRNDIYEHIRDEVQELYPGYKLNMAMDIDI